MMDNINEFKVTDRETFVKFITQLRKDLLENPDKWENKTLADFLEAISSYTEDIQGYYDNTNQDIDADKANWETFSDIFKGARIYE